MSLMAYLKTKDLDNMQELLVEELKDLYDVENRIIDSLPKMEEAATNPNLKEAFRKHKQQSQWQKERLERCFQSLGIDPDRSTCDGIKGILEEGETVLKAKGDPRVKDAALIASAQRVEHYEMAAYGAARTFARNTNHDDVAELLQQTLDEEGNTDHELTELGVSQVNPPSGQ
ncbi:MAG: ferritin-like domain-containing protein [Phycisphaerae bacterium]